MPDYFRRIDSAARFDTARAVKADVFASERLFVGLNCFAAGQAQAIHTHAAADKFYLVVSGKARMTIGDTTTIAEAGTVGWAPAGVPHGVDEALEATVMLVAMTPPPGRSG